MAPQVSHGHEIMAETKRPIHQAANNYMDIQKFFTPMTSGTTKIKTIQQKQTQRKQKTKLAPQPPVTTYFTPSPKQPQPAPLGNQPQLRNVKPRTAFSNELGQPPDQTHLTQTTLWDSHS
eukprot:11468740-Ditylum_brightwellii.AAC.1